ncbi:hypothetical protein ABTM69_20295, partial [Acinetobacter baumannii]
FANLSYTYDSARNMTVLTDSVTGIKIDLYGNITLTDDDFIFQPLTSATFIGTSGDDVANVPLRTLTGFTGGTRWQLSDAIGDTFMSGD